MKYELERTKRTALIFTPGRLKMKIKCSRQLITFKTDGQGLPLLELLTELKSKSLDALVNEKTQTLAQKYEGRRRDLVCQS